MAAPRQSADPTRPSRPASTHLPALGIVWVASIVAVAGAIALGVVAADAVPSESAGEDWHMKSVLAGWAAAAGVLIVFVLVLLRRSRSLDSFLRSRLLRHAATILVTPPTLVTALFIGLVAPSGGSEELVVKDVLAEWAVIVVPSALASGFLFTVARRATSGLSAGQRRCASRSRCQARTSRAP